MVHVASAFSTSQQFLLKCMHQNSMCSLFEAFLHVLWAWTCRIVWSGSSSSWQFVPLIPSLFALFFSVVSLFPFPTWGFIAGFWVARSFQLWEQSPSRSWLPIVGAPGCLSHSSWKLIVLVWCDCVQCRPSCVKCKQQFVCWTNGSFAYWTEAKCLTLYN